MMETFGFGATARIAHRAVIWKSEIHFQTGSFPGKKCGGEQNTTYSLLQLFLS